jgi:anti-sigma B factor antagonist
MSPVSPSVTSTASSLAYLLPFVCRWKPDGFGSAWVHLSGELDLSTSPLFGQTVRDALQNACAVSIDLQELAFIDCSALAVLLDASSIAQELGCRLILVRGSGQVDRVMALTGILERFEVIDFSGRPGGGRGSPEMSTRVS